jgi:hypothetical protein
MKVGEKDFKSIDESLLVAARERMAAFRKRFSPFEKKE